MFFVSIDLLRFRKPLAMLLCMAQMHGGYCHPICWNVCPRYCTHWRCVSSDLVQVAAQCCCPPWRNTGGSGVKNGTPEIDFGKLQLSAQEPGFAYGGPAVRNLPRRTPGTKIKWTNWWKQKVASGDMRWYEIHLLRSRTSSHPNSGKSVVEFMPRLGVTRAPMVFPCTAVNWCRDFVRQHVLAGLGPKTRFQFDGLYKRCIVGKVFIWYGSINSFCSYPPTKWIRLLPAFWGFLL